MLRRLSPIRCRPFVMGALILVGLQGSFLAHAAQMVRQTPVRSEILQENRWHSAVSPTTARANALAYRAEAYMVLAPSDELIELHLQRLQGSPRLQAARRDDARELRRRLLGMAERASLIALQIVPDHALATFVLARTRDLCGAEPSETIPMFERLLTLLDAQDTERRATVLFSLGVAYTKQLRFEAARDSYLELVRDPFAPGREVTLCNLAETYMYLHDVDASLERYNECATALPQRATGWWGLAIAHDRAGHESDGRRAADRALPVDPDLRDIRGDGVFYVPEYERWYYEGMAFEAIARSALSMVDRRAALNSAAGCWNRYITAAPSTDSWLHRVRAHSASVLQQLIELQQPIRAPRPVGRQ